MKTLYLILFFISLNFTGCYTILWSPEDEFPSESSYSGYDDGYYSDPYYGGYSYYYEYPWWLSIVPPTISNQGENENTNRSDDVRSVRNSGGRNSSNERSTTPTTSRSSGSSSGSTTNSTPQSEVRSSDNNSGSSSSGTRNETRNSGSRNSGKGRK